MSAANVRSRCKGVASNNAATLAHATRRAHTDADDALARTVVCDQLGTVETQANAVIMLVSLYAWLLHRDFGRF